MREIPIKSKSNFKSTIKYPELKEYYPAIVDISTFLERLDHGKFIFCLIQNDTLPFL